MNIKENKKTIDYSHKGNIYKISKHKYMFYRDYKGVPLFDYTSSFIELRRTSDLNVTLFDAEHKVKIQIHLDWILYVGKISTEEWNKLELNEE